MKTKIPAGKYYLGDPCYSVPNNEWDDLLDTCQTFQEPVGMLRDGTKIYALPTAYGNGTYEDSDGFGYGVDTGLIGLVSVGIKLDGDFNPDIVNIVEFLTDTVMFDDQGVLTFGHIVIDTAYEGTYDEDQEDLGDRYWNRTI